MYVLTIRQNLALAPATRRSILCEKYTITNPSAERHSRWLNKRSNEREVFFARARPAWFTSRIKDGWVKRYYETDYNSHILSGQGLPLNTQASLYRKTLYTNSGVV